MPTLVPTLVAPDSLQLTLPNGRTVIARVLPLKRACHFLRLELQRETEADPLKRLDLAEKIIDTFPNEVGLEQEYTDHPPTWGEHSLIFWAFFAEREPAQVNGTAAPLPTGAAS